ncbi:MAG: hypothetical protein ABIG84_00060 [archaeon]
MRKIRLLCRAGKMKPKAQVSIEFIAGFGIFIMVVSYIIYASIMVFPKYFDESRENAIREEAWTLSIEVMDYLKNDTRVNNQSIASLGACGIFHYFDDTTTMDDDYSRANYSYFKELFYVDGQDDFRIIIKSSPVIRTDYMKGLNRTGNSTIGGIEYVFESIFNTTSLFYDSVAVFNSSGLIAVVAQDDAVQLGKYTFSFDKIDTTGEFLILGVDMLDCGKYAPMSASSSKVTRFTAYNNWITTVDIVYW